MPYANEHSCRLVAPGDGEVRRTNGAARIDGRPVDHVYLVRGGRSVLQAVRFPRAHGWDSEAATEVAREWCREHGGRFEPMSSATTASGGSDMWRIDLYVTDSRAFPVGVEERDGAIYLRGLPLMRVGRWNGEEYDDERLRRIAANYARIAAEDRVVPALKSRHTYTPEGPENVDAAEVTRGWFEALWFDERTGVLFGDVRVVDPSLVEDMRTGRVRYVSAEISRDYVLADSEEPIGPALVGAAWVDWPAVKGLPWEIVLNREAWAGLEPGVGAHCRRNQEGGSAMRSRWAHFVDTLKDLFAGRGDVEALDAFRAGPGEEVTVAMAQEPEVQKPENTGTEEPPTPQAEALAREVELLRAEHGKAQKRIAELEAARRQAEVTRLADQLTTGGVVPPAQRARMECLLEDMLERRVAVPDAEGVGKGSDRPAVEVLVELLEAVSPKGLTGPAGRARAAGEGDEPGPEVLSDEKLATLVMQLTSRERGGQADG